jgi:indole-3-glycerol phosphate synthase
LAEERVSGDVLGMILVRKAREVTRRRRFAPLYASAGGITSGGITLRGITFDPSSLRRSPGALPHVIAEIKHRSPSAGALRARSPGSVASIARAYEAAGASAVSVLCDGPGFAGSVLDVRRAARAVSLPILFKEFVLDPLQLDVARAMSASLVLLIVRALSPKELSRLIREAHARDLVPIVEAADAEELRVALSTDAKIVGMNARDLRSFTLDGRAAQAALESVPTDRVAVYMSGIKSGTELANLAKGRADAVLMGSEMMQAPDPGARLESILREARRARMGDRDE